MLVYQLCDSEQITYLLWAGFLICKNEDNDSTYLIRLLWDYMSSTYNSAWNILSDLIQSHLSSKYGAKIHAEVCQVL